VEDEAVHEDKITTAAKAARACDFRLVVELTNPSVSLAQMSLTLRAACRIYLEP